MRVRARHPEKALTATAVKQIKKPGRYSDGNGLYLVVDESGARRWLLRTVVLGRRRDIGLGSARLVPLADAREEAARMRRLARDGGDPIAERRRARMVVPTFKEAAEKVHAETAGNWKNEKHAAQWLTTLERYAFPVLGKRPVDQIATADVLKVLSAIWLTKPETARRLRQRVRTVLDWARVAYG
ncbi:MAG TPA: Arm DNA-binding domain-containing protein, partial [Hyphomicrobiaceae bacterium]|nr:Arm DNA-binding domain-containing protein [Hyphomicrobiaceae bacterium]